MPANESVTLKCVTIDLCTSISIISEYLCILNTRTDGPCCTSLNFSVWVFEQRPYKSNTIQIIYHTAKNNKDIQNQFNNIWQVSGKRSDQTMFMFICNIIQIDIFLHPTNKVNHQNQLSTIFVIQNKNDPLRHVIFFFSTLPDSFSIIN